MELDATPKTRTAPPAAFPSNLAVMLSAEQYDAIEARAAKRGVSKAVVVREALALYFAGATL